MVRPMASSRTPAVSISSSQRAIRVPRKRIVELAALVAAAERARLAEVDVAVVSAREIAKLNRRYLGHAGATDVLSFDLSDPTATGISAQVIVCGDVAVSEAAARGLRPQHELLRYVLHGLLHVLGYNDGEPAKSARMHARQEELLAKLLSRRGGARSTGRAGKR
jgi:probable rRNA maturation factor